jgi:branched-subunit amino acid transport protein
MTVGRWLLVFGFGCLAVVVLTHIAEKLNLFPVMGWGLPDSPGHYLDLVSPRMLRALIWPFAFAAMDDAGAAAFRAWPHVKSVSNVAATAIVTDHAWPQSR